MTQTTFEAFCLSHRDEGFTEFVEKPWAADLELDTHQHPFDVRATVIAGEMWLTHSEQQLHLRAGDRFELAANVPHAERYGAQGATVWIARRYL